MNTRMSLVGVQMMQPLWENGSFETKRYDGYYTQEK